MMQESKYQSYDELPLFLNAELMAEVLGVSPPNGYELMHEPDFPVLKVGSRMVVPKEKFKVTAANFCTRCVPSKIRCRHTVRAHKGQRRKPGTGCVTQINEKLWEGRYSPIWPDGKKHARSVYAHSEDECEKLLAELIAEMKAQSLRSGGG